MAFVNLLVISKPTCRFQTKPVEQDLIFLSENLSTANIRQPAGKLHLQIPGTKKNMN